MHFDIADYDFHLPPDRIAQFPAEPRDSARLLVVERTTGNIQEGTIRDLPAFLSPQDALILNDTKVLHARVAARLEDGRAVSCLLTRCQSPNSWWVLAKPGRLLKEGTSLLFPGGISAVVIADESAEKLLRFSVDITPRLLEEIGQVPLPPYIRRMARGEDAQRYQTIYGKNYGSVAAPTAGLHCTETVFQDLAKRGVSRHFVTLHVGTGTFLPIRVQDVREHKMHFEQFVLKEEVAAAINAVQGRKIAVGTTACRVLESCADAHGVLHAQEGETNLFIHPEYKFTCVSALLTNFHTPCSSLLVLVGAFMGYELMKEAYAQAIDRGFRFFSYGDAMLIL
jgi:S-adenosylmethionine:tRNA ribosyltransferase-isomerase